MEKYIVVTENTEKVLKEIHTEFLNKFKVDLDNEWYVKISGIENKWNTIVQSCFGDVEHKMFRNYVEELYGFMEWITIREMNEKDENEETLEERARLEKELFELIHKYQGFVGNYSLYEMDVWIEALFSIKYIESKKRINKEKEENRKKLIVQGTEGLDKQECYEYPLEHGEEIFFSKSCVTEVVEKHKTLFLFDFFQKDIKDTKKRENHNKSAVRRSNYGYVIPVELRIPKDTDFTRWSCKKISSLEKTENFLIEDKIFLIRL